MTSGVKLAIEGEEDIQKVGFRLYLFKKALELGISHFQAENEPNGKGVIVLLDGEDERVKEYVAFVEGMKSNNPGIFRLEKVASEEHKGRIMGVADFGSYLTNDQLMLGRDVLVTVGSDIGKGFKTLGSDIEKGFESLGDKITGMGDRFADTVSDELGHTNARLDKLTKKEPEK